MKQTTIGALAFAFLLFSTVALASETKKAILGVKGMTCAGCVYAVKSNVKKIEGISSVDVDLKEGKATIEYDPERVSPEDLAKVINKLGFEASVPKAEKTAPESELKAEDPEESKD